MMVKHNERILGILLGLYAEALLESKKYSALTKIHTAKYKKMKLWQFAVEDVIIEGWVLD